MAAAAAQAMDHDKYFDAHPSPRPATHDIAVALAHEGVPVRAIARSIKTPGEEVYEILKYALDDGRLIELPRDDWPSRSNRRERTQAETSILQLDDRTLQTACSTLFKLTPLQSSVFATLIRRPSVTKDQLHQAVENNRDDNVNPTEKKIVDVVICHIRRKIKVHNVEIGTLWGIGYSMKAEARERVMTMLVAHMQEQSE